MIYAALGDSITHGYDATESELGYAWLVAQALGKRDRVNLHVEAKPGWTSKQLLKSVEKLPPCIWAEARLVTLLVGGNDLLHSTPWLANGDVAKMLRVADACGRNLDDIIRIVKPPYGKLIIGTVYNPFPNSMIASEATDYLNQAIRQVAKREKLIVADVQAHFYRREARWIDGFRRGDIRDAKLFRNPIHPNDAGHVQISRVFLRAYRQSLTKERTASRKLRPSR